MEYNKLQDWEKAEVLAETAKMYPHKQQRILLKALTETNPTVWYNPDDEEWSLWDACRQRFEAAISGSRNIPL
jgi:hypothetical protein